MQLMDWLRECCEGNIEAYDDWIGQLKGKPNYINSMHALEEIAMFDDSWKDLCDRVSSALRVKLTILKENVFDKKFAQGKS
jgi:hypothetical protein